MFNDVYFCCCVILQTIVGSGPRAGDEMVLDTRVMRCRELLCVLDNWDVQDYVRNCVPGSQCEQFPHVSPMMGLYSKVSSYPDQVFRVT